MDQQQLIDRLERQAADVPVGPPPFEAMRAGARRRRHRWAVVAAAGATAAVIAVASVWPGGDPESTPPVASDPVAENPPAGQRYVGIGPAVIAVPEAWGTNEVGCGTPQRDTVVIDLGAVCLALIPRPDGVDSVAVQAMHGNPEDTSGLTPIEIDGEPALLAPVRTHGNIASATVYLPTYAASFVAESSSADAEQVVRDLIDGIAILQDHTTVPGFQDLAYDRDPSPMHRSYVHRLSVYGLSAVVIREASNFESGTVIATQPAVGSVVAPGETVTVTVAR